MKFAGVVILFVVVAITWSKLFGIPGEYGDLRSDLEAAYAGAYGEAEGKTLCKYQKVADRHWLGCRGGLAPFPAVWELVDSAGVAQCLAANGKAAEALDRFSGKAGQAFIRSGDAVLPDGVLSAFQ